MNERLDRFTKLLKEIFELDKSDLDFGIYRVMNLRKAQIEQFLTERLPKMVQETLAPFAQGSKVEIRAKMKQIEESVAEMGMTVDALPNTAQKKQQYLQLQKQLAEGADLAALETDVYSALYSFFNRYYEDGDFISKRRYKEGVYAIPYEGEEVKLYWANQDQYYIKTSENFKDYTFVFDGINVHFRLVDATTEQNNNKESKDNKRAFMLFREDEEIYPGIKTFEYTAVARCAEHRRNEVCGLSQGIRRQPRSGAGGQIPVCVTTLLLQLYGLRRKGLCGMWRPFLIGGIPRWIQANGQQRWKLRLYLVSP